MAKVLLVEDDNNLREIYEARLQAEGYTIASARDGEEALVVAKNEKPDLIISDVMMPKISGFEMLDILRNTEDLKDVKVIMLTALGQSDDQQRADRLGADRYLVKSQVTLEDIVNVAQQLLADATPAAAVPAETPALDSVASQSTVASTPSLPVPPLPPVVVEPSPLVLSTEPAEDTNMVPEPAPESAASAALPVPPITTNTVPEPIIAPVVTQPLVLPAPITDEPIVVETPAPVVSDLPTLINSTPIEPIASTQQPTTPDIEQVTQLSSAMPNEAPIPELGYQPSSDDDATPLIEEANDVEAQIEAFVSQATVEPAPQAEPGTGPEPMPAAELQSSEEATTDDSAATQDDALMADAINKLSVTIPSEPAPAAETVTEPAPTPILTAPSSSLLSPEPVAPAPDETAESTPTSTPAPSQGGQKIIAPLPHEETADLASLLAAEDAKDSQPSAAPTQIVITEPEAIPTSPETVITPSPVMPTPVVQPPEEPEKIDPNSIAL
jgi:CheY-like chemotaxis protein